MFANIKNYIIGVLLILTTTFGYMSYTTYGKYAAVVADVVRLEGELKTATVSTQKAVTSCEAGHQVVTSTNGAISTQLDAMTKHLEGLAALPVTTLQDTHENASKASTGASTKYADGSRLSPGLMQLLDAAYCNSNKNDSSCTAK